MNMTIFQFQSTSEETANTQEELIQLHPFGVSITSDIAPPFLLLRDETQKKTLAVAISHLDAGVLLSQANRSGTAATPHRFSALLLEEFHLRVSRCVFVEIKGQHQWVRLELMASGAGEAAKIEMGAEIEMDTKIEMESKKEGGFSGKNSLSVLKMRADEAMSFCVYFNVPFYATATFIEKSKVLFTQKEALSNQLPLRELSMQKKDRYLM